MSNSVWPHRRQPTRLLHPWDSPGKNTGVGCHFLLQCMKVKSESQVAQSCPTLSDPTPWTAAHQAPPSMGFSRQEYWSGVPLPSLSESHSLLYFLPFQATRYFLQTLGWQYANKPTLQFCNLLPGLEEFEAPLFPEFLPLFTSSWEVKKETGNAYYTLGTVR